MTDAISRTINNIKNKVTAFVNDFRQNGVGSIKRALKDLKDSIVLSVKRTGNKLMTALKSKEDFMGLVKDLSEKYSLSKIGDRISDILANINDKYFAIKKNKKEQKAA